MKKYIIGVDFGGTSISAGLILDGDIIKISNIPTQALETTEIIINNLFTAINEVLVDEVSAIGIGIPGVVDSKNGIVKNIANIPTLKNVFIKKLVEEQFGITTYLGNDANCFALGVKYFGTGKTYSNIIGVTLGTGLGTGLIINNELYAGLENGAGELGMISYLDSNIEKYCSGQFFSDIKNTSGKEIYKKAQGKDKNALAIWVEYGKHLGQLVNIITYTYAPELVAFGGSVAQGFDFFIDSVKKELKTNVCQSVVDKMEIINAQTGNSAILGAGALGM